MKIRNTINPSRSRAKAWPYVLLGLILSCFLLIHPRSGLAAPGDSSFSWESGLDLFYDDNILRYSDQDAQNPKVADVIYEPYVLGQYKRYFGKYPLRLFGDIAADFYQDNSYKNYETYRFGLKQSLPKKTEFVLSAVLMPRFYISQTQSLRYTSLTFEERTQVIRGLMVGLTGRYGRKNYDLDPYDTDFWEAGLQGSYKRKYVRIGGGYSVEEGTATGDVDTDPSYREHSYHVIAALYPRRGTRLWVKMTRSTRDFTTPFPVELIRYGRTDSYRTYRIRLTQDLGKRVEGRLGYERVNRDVSGISAQDKQLLDYGENIYRIGVSVYW